MDVVETNLEHGFRNYRDAEQWAKDNICKTYTNEETGGKGLVKIDNGVINKYVSSAARDKSDSEDLHYAVLKVLPELIHNGIDAETHPNFRKVNGARLPENGMDKNLLMHRVYAAVSVDGKLCRVKISMKENMTGMGVPTKPYSYEVTDISTKIEPLETIGVQAQSEDGISKSSISAANLLKDVEMSYDPGKKLLDESEDLTNESSRQTTSTQSGVRESRRVSGRLANTGNTSSVAQRIYEEAVRGIAFEFDEAWHDSLVSVKELQDALAKERGVAIRDLENVYLHLVHLSSVSATEMTEYRNQQVENLLDAMGRTARPFVTLRRGAGFQPAETERHL